jgi:hypothetical protein
MCQCAQTLFYNSCPLRLISAVLGCACESLGSSPATETIVGLRGPRSTVSATRANATHMLCAYPGWAFTACAPCRSLEAIVLGKCCPSSACHARCASGIFLLHQSRPARVWLREGKASAHPLRGHTLSDGGCLRRVSSYPDFRIRLPPRFNRI